MPRSSSPHSSPYTDCPIVAAVIIIIIIIIISTIHGGIIPNKLHETLKVLNPRPGVCIRMRTAVMLNICRMVRKFLAEQ